MTESADEPAAMPQQTDEGTWQCMGDGRLWSSRERALRCPCGWGALALSAAATVTLATMQEITDRAAAVLGAVIDHATPGASPTTLADLATAVTTQTAVLERQAAQLAAQQEALDELVLRSLGEDLPVLPDLPGGLPL